MKNLTKTQKIFAGIGITLLIVLILACGIVDAWYVYLRMHAPDKMTSTTVNIGEVETDSGDKAYVWEANLFTNETKNGLECFELKSTYFTDETKKNLYSQGLQYVANTSEDTIDWYTFEEYQEDINDATKKEMKKFTEKADISSYKLSQTGILWWSREYYANYFSPVLESEASKYNYQSYDGYATTESTNPLTLDSYLTLETADNQMLYMQFKGDNYATFKSVNEFKADPKKIGQHGDINYYYNYTVDCFAQRLYDAVKTLPAGTSATIVFEFGDNYKYYDVDPTQSSGEEIQSIDYDLVKNKIKSYYTIKVNVSADGIKNAGESMFGVLHGSPNYVVNGDTTTSEYFTGKTLIDCQISDFELVQVAEGKVALKLKESFVNEYKKYSNSIALRIVLDNDIFEQYNVEFLGFTADSGLEQFEVYEIQQINTEVA